MTLLLLVDVPGLGTRHSLVDVSEERGFALLTRRQALCATDRVRKKYRSRIVAAYPSRA